MELKKSFWLHSYDWKAFIIHKRLCVSILSCTFKDRFEFFIWNLSCRFLITPSKLLLFEYCILLDKTETEKV